MRILATGVLNRLKPLSIDRSTMSFPKRFVHFAEMITKLDLTRRLLLLITAIAASRLSAQDVVMSPPVEPLLPPSQRNATPPPASRPPPSENQPIKIGAVFIHSRLSYGYLNAEGLPTKKGGRVSSEIHSTHAQLLADIGEHWALEYSPSWRNYTSNALSDSFDQSMRLSGDAAFRDFGFKFAESYEVSKPTLAETARQTEVETWATNLGLSYKLSPHISLMGSAKLDERYTDIAPRVRRWSGQTKINLIFSPRLNLAFGPGFQYTEITNAPDIYGESYTAELNWHPSDKLTLAVDAGLQKTHSTSSAGLNLSKPKVDLSLNYRPFETTSVRFAISQKVSSSYFKDLVTEDLLWEFGFQQRLLGRFYLDAAYSQKENDYTYTNVLSLNNRSDLIKMWRAHLSTKLLKRFAIAATFQKTTNASNLSAFAFSSKQYGGEISCRF